MALALPCLLFITTPRRWCEARGACVSSSLSVGWTTSPVKARGCARCQVFPHLVAVFSTFLLPFSLLLASDLKEPMSEPSALVVYGSTGRRLLFSKQDLVMPESVRQLPNHGFYEKQWDTVAGHWFNRVLKEERLQSLSVAQLVEHITADIAKRWQARRAEQALHKKRKRLLVDNGPAGTPSPRVLLTNLCTLHSFTEGTEEDKRDFLKTVLARAEDCAKEKAASVELLVDAEAEAPSPPPAAKKPRTETATSADATNEDDDAVAFDDRVAVVVTFSSNVKAASVVAQLHGTKFDGRPVLCRFFS